MTVSVFIPLYNHETFVQAALTSALHQTLEPNEIVVIDDGSDDGSVAAVDKLSNPIIRLMREGNNLGGPVTRLGLSCCKGDAIAILNSDDTWELNKLERQVEYLAANPNCGAVFTFVNLLDEQGKPWKPGTNQQQSRFNVANKDRSSWLRHFFYSGNAFCASSAMVRGTVFEKVGLTDGSYVQLQDFEMWVRVVLGGYDIHVIQEPLTNYRITRQGTNMSLASPRNLLVTAVEYARLLRNYWNIQSLDELRTIFPEIEISNRANDLLVLFYLARHAAAQRTLHHRLFAIDTMAKWGGNLDAMRLAASCEGFTHVDYQKFLLRWPIWKCLSFGARLKGREVINKLIPYDLQQRILTFRHHP